MESIKFLFLWKGGGGSRQRHEEEEERKKKWRSLRNRQVHRSLIGLHALITETHKSKPTNYFLPQIANSTWSTLNPRNVFLFLFPPFPFFFFFFFSSFHCFPFTTPFRVVPTARTHLSGRPRLPPPLPPLPPLCTTHLFPRIP